MEETLKGGRGPPRAVVPLERERERERGGRGREREGEREIRTLQIFYIIT